LSSAARDVVAIEINLEMYQGLKQNASALTNVRTIRGDFFKLDELLPDHINLPVFLILQNTLGTLEGGEADEVAKVVKQEAINRNGELVLSLLRQPALRGWGISMYKRLAPMVGNVDMDRSDFQEGLLITDTNYTSKWWTDEDINNFRALGNLIRESSTNEYIFLELSF
jgi:hypothetical protein